MGDRPERLVIVEVVAWVALVAMIGLCLTQWFGIEGSTPVTALQALTPWVLLWAFPIALMATTFGRYPLALTALVPLATLLALSYPIVFHGGAPSADGDSPHITVAYANLLYSNTTPEQAAQTLLGADADVLVMVELATAVHAAVVDAASAGGYPYRAEHIDSGAGAIGVWSRYPITSGGVVEVEQRPTVDVLIDVGGRSVRMLGVHPYPPTHNAAGWSAQLNSIGQRAAGSTIPTIVVGDFNAARWHPSYRALLATGLRSGHEVLGQGWSGSWPMDRGVLPPPFIRIDHALFGDGITPVAMDDVDVPGSDHRGFVATFGFTQAG